MQKRYIFLAILFIGMASGLLYLPDMKEKNQIPAESFLNDIHSNNRYLTSDEIAKIIIDGDPMLFIVDVRTEAEYNNYSLPGSINIPLKDLLLEDWAGYLDQDIQDVIFYSNDDVLSEEAWALCKQNGFSNLYVLDGGLNRWFATIMLPEKPGELASTADFDLYSFRTGASIYFGSGSTAVAVEAKPKTDKKKTIPVKKKAKRAAEGGC
jgi:rhodanese-related sulfurtransferase